MAWTGRRLLAAIGLAGSLALGGCAYDDGYYGGVSVGSGYYGGGYYDDYWGPGYYRPGYYGGWYDGYYYPGSGYYVYNRSGHRQRWNDGQRRYWEGRRDARRSGMHHWCSHERQTRCTCPAAGGRHMRRTVGAPQVSQCVFKRGTFLAGSAGGSLRSFGNHSRRTIAQL